MPPTWNQKEISVLFSLLPNNWEKGRGEVEYRNESLRRVFQRTRGGRSPGGRADNGTNARWRGSNVNDPGEVERRGKDGKDRDKTLQDLKKSRGQGNEKLGRARKKIRVKRGHSYTAKAPRVL